jgi:hypothetical protein
MAESRGRGDERQNPHDGVGRAGARVKMEGAPAGSPGHTSGQQSGGKRPAMKTGAAKQAPKKGEKG